MDSWIMAMYFFLFGVWTGTVVRVEEKEAYEDELINVVAAIFYGDDHLWNKGDGVTSRYLTCERFAKFCEKYLGVQIRDLRGNLPFCSKTFGGWLVHEGATFLQHQFILNPYKKRYPDQPDFLPFRETREFLIRAVWGRETRIRTPIDVVQSIIGHAYGTYAGNYDAYVRLRLMFHSLVRQTGITPGVLIRQSMDQATVEDLKKLRQLGVTADEILRGFPSFDTLIKKNTMDWDYHNNIRDEIDVGDLDVSW